MSGLLGGSLGLVRGWTWFYTLAMDRVDRDQRRAEIESDLWEFHEDARRRGCSPEMIAAHMLVRLVLGAPDDVVWRAEYEGDAAITRRRSSLMTVAAVGAAVGVAALWALFAVTSLVSLPPLPDSTHVERIYLHAPPPPPPPPPGGSRPSALRIPPPPPPPPPR